MGINSHQTEIFSCPYGHILKLVPARAVFGKGEKTHPFAKYTKNRNYDFDAWIILKTSFSKVDDLG